MSSLPHITVILTCYSEGVLLRQSEESLLNQTYADWHCVVVNDASSDPLTNRICEELQGLPRFKVIRNSRNLGLSGSRNAGILADSGELFLPLDGDDRLPPDSLQKVAEVFAAYPKPDFIYGDFEEFGETPQLHRPGPVGLEDLLMSQPIGGHSPFRRRVWEKIGGFAQELSWGNQDWDFWLSVFEAGFKGQYVPHVLYEWRIRPKSMHTSYDHRWPEICEFMYRKHQAAYDRFGKGPEFLAWGWSRAALHHYSQGRLNKARACAEEALSLVPSNRQMAGLRFRCSLPAGVLSTARAIKHLAAKTFNRSSSTS